MAEQDDIIVGRRALEKQLVARDALVDCIFASVAERKGENARGFPRPLAVLLVQRGLLTDPQLMELLGDRFSPARPTGRIGDLAIGELLVGLGYVRKEQVLDALEMQKMTRKIGAPRPRLGEILLERGAVTAEGVARALAYQAKEIYRCTRCAVRVNLSNPRPELEHVCQLCGGVLVPAESGIGVHDSVVVEAPVAARRGRSLTDSSVDEGGSAVMQGVDPQQLETDRAVDMYVRQKGLTRRETMREARRVQMEVARYGIAVPLLDVLKRTNAITSQQAQLLEKEDFAAVVRGGDWKDQEVPGYKVLERIAFGGFATIYTAQPVFGQGTVALKTLRPERADESAVARFKREASLLRKLDHAGIIKGLEHGHTKGVHYIVMEYFPGISLGQLIAEGRGMAPRQAVVILRQIVEALDYLRRERYIHRDVKPDNILVDTRNRAKLCDLGFAVEIPAPGTATKVSAAGTPGYVSPELMRGESDVGIGTDIYSLGITFYAMLAGVEPFVRASSEVMVADYVEGGLPPPDLLKVQAPPPVLDLVRRMTHPDRERRIPSYQDIFKALDALGA